MNTSSFAAVIFAKSSILKWLNNSPLHRIHLVRVYSVEILLSGTAVPLMLENRKDSILTGSQVHHCLIQRAFTRPASCK